MAAEELPGIGLEQLVVGSAGVDKARLERQGLGVLEHLVDPAARLDRAGDGQVAVLLEEQAAGEVRPVPAVEGLQHRGCLHQRGLDDAVGACGLGEAALDEGCEPGEARLGVVDVGRCERGVRQAVGGGGEVRVDPGRGGGRAHGCEGRVVAEKVREVGDVHGVLSGARVPNGEVGRLLDSRIGQDAVHDVPFCGCI